MDHLDGPSSQTIEPTMVREVGRELEGEHSLEKSTSTGSFTVCEGIHGSWRALRRIALAGYERLVFMDLSMVRGEVYGSWTWSWTPLGFPYFWVTSTGQLHGLLFL